MNLILHHIVQLTK